MGLLGGLGEAVKVLTTQESTVMIGGKKMNKIIAGIRLTSDQTCAQCGRFIAHGTDGIIHYGSRYFCCEGCAGNWASNN